MRYLKSTLPPSPHAGDFLSAQLRPPVATVEEGRGLGRAVENSPDVTRLCGSAFICLNPSETSKLNRD